MAPAVELFSEQGEVRRVDGAEPLSGVPEGWIVVRPNGANSATFQDAGWEYTIRTPPGTDKSDLEDFITNMIPRQSLADDIEFSEGLDAPERTEPADPNLERSNVPLGFIFRR